MLSSGCDGGFQRLPIIKKVCYLLCLGLMGWLRLSAQTPVVGEMPIIAYWGVPENYTSDAHFRAFRDCGFTVSLYPYSSLSDLVMACRMADRVGVKVLGYCPEMKTNPQRTAGLLSQEEGFYGYFIQDEPTEPQLHERQREMARLRHIDSTHCYYINLLPCYENTTRWLQSVIRVTDYTDYLKTASATSCQQISFDFYPILKDSVRSTWYQNLEMVRRESMASGKPFWGFVLSVPHMSYPQPTMGSFRLQAYSNLAYGAQAIEYFTYWTPTPTKEWDFHDAPIGLDGQQTWTFKLVQAMNTELKAVAPLFYGSRVLSVHHLGTIPEGTTRQTRMPVNIKSLKIVGSQGAVISQFEKDRHRYLAIVNKSHERSLTVLIQNRNDTPRRITKQLEEEPMRPSYALVAGDMLLFRLK